jgi:hypothetical protein
MAHRHRKSHKRGTHKRTLGKRLSNKYMPKVKSGLENVGAKVINTSQRSVPYLQQLTRKLFSAIGIKQSTNTNTRRRRH